MALPSFVAFSIAGLHTELVTDPLSLGYAAIGGNQNQNGVADLLNIQHSGGGWQVARSPVTPADAFLLIDATEFASLTTTNLSRLLCILALPLIDFRQTNIQDICANIFPPGGPTRANFVNFITRDGSRAEVLWGPGKVITTNEINQAYQV